MLGLVALAGALAAAVAFGGEDSSTEAGAGVGPVTGAIDAGRPRQRHDHKHAANGGHLAATSANVELVSTLALKNVVRKKVADVAVLRDHAYLGAWGGRTCKHSGVHVVDIRDPAAPRKIGFIRARSGSYPGEGVQALHVDTPAFDGDLLVTNNETCDRRARLGGFNLYDVSNPRRPRRLIEGFGDRTAAGRRSRAANEIHSVFVWDAGRRAYAVLVDNREGNDVDIVEISNPRTPALVAEYDLDASFPRVVQSRPAKLTEIFHHDVVVKRIGARQIMLVSYWDGGYVKLDVTDPRDARFLADSDFANPDPELLEQSQLREPPEGNAHQAEFTKKSDYIIAADEDFSATGIEAKTDDGGAFSPVPGSSTPAIEPGDAVSGWTRYVGRACKDDPPVPPAAGARYAVVSRGLCRFTQKLAKVQDKGYSAAIVVNHEGVQGCGPFGMAVKGAIPALAVARSVGFGLFDRTGYSRAACRAGAEHLLPRVPVGQRGDRVTARGFFDGWGYVHLFRNDGRKLRELDTYAIDEAMDPAYAQKHGDLSVHEVATSLDRNDLAYFSYYAGGLRVARIVDGELVEVGRFIDEKGNNFWGVQVFEHGGREYVAASDIDFGLYIFRYTGTD